MSSVQAPNQPYQISAAVVPKVTYIGTKFRRCLIAQGVALTYRGVICYAIKFIGPPYLLSPDCSKLLLLRHFISKLYISVDMHMSMLLPSDQSLIPNTIAPPPFSFHYKTLYPHQFTSGLPFCVPLICVSSIAVLH